MKKLFLSLVFVFAFVAVTPTSAKSNENTAGADCFSVCDFIASFSGMNFNLTYEQEHEVFVACMDGCTEQ